MLSRRVLLGAAALASVTGCGVFPGMQEPRIAPPPDPSVPGHAALESLQRAISEAGSATLTRAQADLRGWAADVNRDQFEATSLAFTSVASPTPRAGATPTDLQPLSLALGEAQKAFTTQALDATTARPLVWASIAAWCAGVAAQLPEALGAREPARGVLLPAPQEPEVAAQAALDAASASLHGLQVAAGAPGLTEQETTALRERRTFWSSLRGDLSGLIREDGATPTPAPPWYQVERVGDPAAARALVARLQATALPVLGRSLAHGPAELRPVLAEVLADIAADVPRWGGLLERWPGLPST